MQADMTAIRAPAAAAACSLSRTSRTAPQDQRIWAEATLRHVEELPAAGGADPQTERWFRVELYAERLDWLPPLPVSLGQPFVVERPDELRDLIAALADRPAASARRTAPHQ